VWWGAWRRTDLRWLALVLVVMNLYSHIAVQHDRYVGFGPMAVNHKMVQCTKMLQRDQRLRRQA
jgi:hypothetical protein